MKQRAFRMTLICSLLAAVAYVAWDSSSKLRTPYQYYSFVKMPPLMSQFVPGELVDGKKMEQRLVLEADHLTLAIPGDSSLCVGVMTATYYDRQNEGYLHFSVILPNGHSLSGDAAFGDMKDNRYHKVCFDFPYEQLPPGEYIVRMEGKQGQPGSSATLWLTKHEGPPFVSRAIVDGKEVDGAIVMGLLARAQAELPLAGVLILVGLYAFLIMVLLLAAFSQVRPKDR